MTVIIDDYKALDMLMNRVADWTQEDDVYKLFEQMYKRYIENGIFNGGEFDVMTIVDNDYINYTEVVYEGEENFNKLLECYKKNGCSDVSEDTNYSCIEAVDDEENPTMFLVRTKEG